MALVNSSVAIPFVPLLRDLCSLLEIGEPEFREDGGVTGYVSVAISFPKSRIVHVFHGFGEPTVGDCYEMAARRMCVFLVERFNVMAYDVNLGLRARNEHCAQMYGCKYDHFSRIERGFASVPIYEITPVEGIDYGVKRVDIDFLALMDTVLEKYHISVTPIIVEHVVPGGYLAWFTILVPRSKSPTHGVMGYKTTTIDATKQTLAREALLLMSLWYRFEIQDVNYYLLAQSSSLMEAGRGVYERIRERVHGIQESKQPLPYIVEQDCATPRGKRNMIPEMQHPPPPPKRARVGNEADNLPYGVVADCRSPDTFSL